MGYMGLDGPGASDMAADAFSVLLDDIRKNLKKAMKEEGNQYNTDGLVNVALILESILTHDGKAIPHGFVEQPDDDFRNLVQKVVKGLTETYMTGSDETTKSQWGDDDENRLMHYDAYKRMRDSLKDWVEHWDESYAEMLLTPD